MCLNRYGFDSYTSLLVNGEFNSNSVWYYADPKPQAEKIRGQVAFWKDVQIV